MHDVLAFFADQCKYVRPDHQSGNQVPQRRTQTQAFGQRHRQHGRSKVYESLCEKFAKHEARCLPETGLTVHPDLVREVVP